MFNVQTLVKTGDRPDRRTVFCSNIWQFISLYPEFFVLTTGKCIQSVTNSKGETFSETASCAARPVLNCQQQHENTQIYTTGNEYKTM
jgi:hypothetical protein